MGEGKSKGTMNNDDWTHYIKSRQPLKELLDAHCPTLANYGDSLASIYKTLSGRIHEGWSAQGLELSRDYIVVSQEWLSREQVLCIASLLVHERYEFRIAPSIPGFGFQDEED
jgi:hypothetical protein